MITVAAHLRVDPYRRRSVLESDRNVITAARVAPGRAQRPEIDADVSQHHIATSTSGDVNPSPVAPQRP